MSHIRNISVATETMPVKHVFTDDELVKMKDEFIARQVKITKLTEDFQEVKDTFKQTTKPLEQEQSMTLSSIRSGYTEEMREVFLVPNHEDGVMQYFTEDGTEVHSRKLRADEKQTNFLKAVGAE